MRENMGIYRGKRVDNGEWVEGHLYEHQPPLQGIVTKDYMPEKSKWYILKTAFADWNMPRQVEFIEIDPATVGEWTGLMDKNGKRIFEGDIVSGRFGAQKIIGNVVYGSDGTFFIDRKGLYGIGLNNAQDWLEVIGTIYDNPELMEGQK